MGDKDLGVVDILADLISVALLIDYCMRWMTSQRSNSLAAQRACKCVNHGRYTVRGTYSPLGIPQLFDPRLYTTRQLDSSLKNELANEMEDN